MTTKITALQFNTLEFIVQGGGRTVMLTEHWRKPHYRQLVRRRLLRLNVDPLKTKSPALYGSITAKGRAAVDAASEAVRAEAAAISNRDYLRAYDAEAA